MADEKITLEIQHYCPDAAAVVFRVVKEGGQQ